MKNRKNFKKKISFKNESISDEEMLQIAFDVNEELNLPDNYKLDEINQQSVEFLKFVQTQRQNLESKHENFKSIDLEFNLNVNNHVIFQDIYDKLNIDNYWISEIKKEFTNLQIQLGNFKKSKEKNLIFYKNVGDLIKDYKLYFENIKYISIPDDSIIKELCTKLTNKLCIKLINHFHKILSKTSFDLQEKILIWIYYLLAILEMPLVDEDNSVLYTLNKLLLRNLIDITKEEQNPSRESIGKKIIFVVISEIFGQKVMINL